jgi:hypothetical protein
VEGGLLDADDGADALGVGTRAPQSGQKTSPSNNFEPQLEQNTIFLLKYFKQ